MSNGNFPQHPYDPFDPKKNQPQKSPASPSIDEPTPNQSESDDDYGFDEGILNIN